jgi:hypothetical protein
MSKVKTGREKERTRGQRRIKKDNKRGKEK